MQMYSMLFRNIKKMNCNKYIVQHNMRQTLLAAQNLVRMV